MWGRIIDVTESMVIIEARDAKLDENYRKVKAVVHYSRLSGRTHNDEPGITGDPDYLSPEGYNHILIQCNFCNKSLDDDRTNSAIARGLCTKCNEKSEQRLKEKMQL